MCQAYRVWERIEVDDILGIYFPRKFIKTIYNIYLFREELKKINEWDKNWEKKLKCLMKNSFDEQFKFT